MLEYIPNTMLGLEYLWGGEINIETTEIYYEDVDGEIKLDKTRVRYTMKNQKLSRTVIKEV